MSRHKKHATKMRRRRHGRRNVGSITENTKVYSASAWWRDNDPSMQVIALDAETAKKLIFKMMDNEAEHASQPDDDMYGYTEEQALDLISWSGIHAFSLGNIVSEREFEDAKRELKNNGYYYPETP